MFEEYTFIQEYFPFIIIVIVIIFSALVMFSILGVSFNNDTTDEKLSKSVSFDANI